MTHNETGAAIDRDCYDVEKNGDFALKLFSAYYHAHNHTGKIYDDLPDFFLIKPEVLEGKVIASRSSDRMLLEDCIGRAKARGGYISVTKHRNPKLGYYWMELSVAPFRLGDAVTKENKGEFFHILTRFIEYTRQNPKVYGDLTAEIDSDKDLALMLDEIRQMGDRIGTMLELYPEQMLVSFNQSWPVTEVKKLLESLKDNDQDWCEVFFEYLIYVMGKKARAAS
ncbi:MAG: hypothetical protein A2Z95_07225 [Gallionellales bacterium GWA2_60_18]|nr:MAG: hypothetical protein A2Z95_07225 [Gallionellales bacterium GWA2_60_18]